MLQRSMLITFLAPLALCAASMPNPAVDEQPVRKTETAVFAGGCFWGVEAALEGLKGVTNAVSGYSGGSKANADYDLVSTGTTGHAESVQVTFDPSQITYGQLLKVFFSFHDPTELNRQGPDSGTQYRSALFYSGEEQKRIAEAYIQQLTAAKAYSKPIVTKVTPLQAFYPAEEHHQDFIKRNPRQAYVVQEDLPKLAKLRKDFPTMLKENKK
ncbi:MAG: peptide-methionine (S)-S-oxide reductase MsrA [Acidobacteriota bacterium]